LLALLWGILVLVSVIWVIVDVTKRNVSTATKVLWIIVALLLGIIGAIIYYFVGRK
jgi:cytochrome c biogenesis factor